MRTISSRKDLNFILEHIIESVQSGQEEIFEISENTHRELESIQGKIEEYKEKLIVLEQETKVLLLEERETKEMLCEVSKDFLEYGEEDIRAAYERANEIRIQCILKKEEYRRVEKEIEALGKEVMAKNQLIEQAERILSRIKSVIDYLMADLSDVGDRLSLLEEQTQVGMRIIRAQEEERRRIARDIHDGPAQDIASMIIKTDIIYKIFKRYPEDAEQELRQLKKHLQNALREIRSIMYDLRPTMIDDLGLAAAVSSMINDISEASKVEIEIRDLSKFPLRSAAVGLVVYRIIQESLNNAVKHSGAEKILVTLNIRKDTVEGSITDDGCGFEPSKVKKLKKHSFGLSSMKERANIIRGSINIESEEGTGTKIAFRVPNEEEIYEK